MADKKKTDELTSEQWLLNANEQLLAADGCALFTVSKGEFAFSYNPGTINDLELIGFLTSIRNSVNVILEDVEEANTLVPCDGCSGDCANCSKPPEDK